MSKKNELSAALGVFQAEEPAAAQPTTNQASEAAAALPANYVEALKASYGEKWSRAARRGNPYGRVNEPIGNYVRASFIMEAQQHKAIRQFAEAEGLQLKEAVEIITEVGLFALTGKGSDDVVVTPIDTAPKFRRKTKRSRK